ncbi:MAG: AAA family ATPase, partial [Myxococcales bacterium]|nr:AAA family ATPase [Myxococcales bacterium]
LARGEPPRPRVVYLRGDSGQGKSRLLRRFREQLRAEPCVVLRGRCREREAVPYKGVDALIDALSTFLLRRTAAELERLRPRSLGALTQVFPVLDELWPPASTEGAAISATSATHLRPRELRGASWAALRQLLGAIAQEQALVLMIDDLHWADLDSVCLLHELLASPGAPPLLLVLSMRDAPGDAEVRDALAASEVLDPARATVIELGPLSGPEAQALATALAREEQAEHVRGQAWAERVALRCAGNPLFIVQSVLGTATAADDEDLHACVARHLEGLEPAARRLLEVVAICGAPMALELALTLAPGAREADARTLRERGLLVTGSSEGAAERVDTAHDRIREVALARLDPKVRAELHAALGAALLARCEGPPRGESLLRIADQLDASVLDRDTLSDTRRLELARLDLEAGEWAIEATTPALARIYFERGWQLVRPWLAAAQSGSGPHHVLCLALALGRARSARTVDEANAIYEGLLRWTLAPSDYAGLVVEAMLSLADAAKVSEALALGEGALRDLGVRLPRFGALPWALWHVWWGRRRLATL